MRLRTLVAGFACAVLLGLVSRDLARAQARKPPPFKPAPAPTLFTMPIVDLVVGGGFNLYTAYTAGLVDGQSPTGATVHVHVFDQATGLPMQSQTATDICNPCSFAVGTTANPGPAPRMVTLRLNQEALEAGGLAANKRGFLQVQIDGDAANVAMEADSNGLVHHVYPVR